MVKDSVVVNCPLGLHIHPAAIVCNEAIKYESVIMLECNGAKRDAKSLLGVLGARVQNGSVVTLTCEGPDEEKALKALTDILSMGLMDNA